MNLTSAARLLKNPFGGRAPAAKALSDEERMRATVEAMNGSKRPAAAKAEAEEEDETRKERDHEDGDAKKGKKADDSGESEDMEKDDADESDDKDKAEKDDSDESDEEPKKVKKSKKAKAEDDDDDDDGKDHEKKDMESDEDDEKEMRGNSPAAAARKRERARCAAILTSKFAARNPDLAKSLAFKTSMTRAEALALLESAPATVVAPAEQLRASRNPNLGAGGVPARSETKAIEASWETAMKRARPGIR